MSSQHRKKYMEVKEEDENNYISYDFMDKKTNHTVGEHKKKMN